MSTDAEKTAGQKPLPVRLAELWPVYAVGALIERPVRRRRTIRRRRIRDGSENKPKRMKKDHSRDKNLSCGQVAVFGLSVRFER
jgi:hypothetical protein